MKRILFIIFLVLISHNSYAQNTFIDGNSISDADIIEFEGISEPATSPSDKARMYFDVTSGTLKCSQDGGAYSDCAGTTITSINDIGDVDTTGVADGKVLKYDSGSGNWIIGDDAGAASGAPTDATYITQTANGSLTNEQALGLLSTGIMKNTTSTGVVSIAVAGTDYVAPAGNVATATALAANGTNASSGNAILGVDASGNAEGAFDVIIPTEIDTFSELDTIVADKSLVNKADGAVWSGVHDFGGATSVEIPNGTSGTTDATGEVYLDTNGDGGTNFSGNVVQIFNGSANKYLFPMDLPDAGTEDNYIIKYDATGKTVQWEVDSGAGGGISNVVEDTTPQLGGNLDVNTFSVVSTSNGDINLLPNGTGFVGIGTSAPTVMLDVNGAAKFAGSGNSYFENQNVGIGTSTPAALLHLAATADPNIVFDTGATDWYIGLDDSDNDQLIIGTGQTVGTAGALYFGTGGNIGVGTTNPSSKLVVNGSVRFSDLTNCDTIDTDANGVLSCGTDASGSGGTANILDLGDDASNESVDLIEIATTGDTNSIFSEPTADKLLITLSNNWPSADTADALSANGANCSAGSAPLGVDASGAAESCTDYEEDLSNSAGLAAAISDETGSGVVVFGTSPTIATPTLTLQDGNGAAPTTDGQIKFDRTTERLQVGDGSSTIEFYSGAHTSFTDIDTDYGAETVTANWTFNTGTLSLDGTVNVGASDIQFDGTTPKKRVFISATGGFCTTTAGCADATQAESTTNKVNYFGAAFDGATDENWQTTFTLPENYDGSTFTAAVEFTATHTASSTVTWCVQGMSITDDDVLDTAFGTAICTNDDTTATGDLQRTAESSAITFSGTPAGGDRVWIQVYRDANAAADDNNADATFLGVWLTFGIDQLSSED